MPVQGQWNLFGLNLPDFGITERLGVGTSNPSYIPQQQPSTSNLPVYNTPFQQALSGQTLGASTGPQQTFGDVMRQTGLGQGPLVYPYAPTGQSGAGPTANNPGGGNPDWNRLNAEDIARAVEVTS